MGTALVGNNFLLIPSKVSFHMKKISDLMLLNIYKALKPFLTCKLSESSKSGSMFSSSEPIAAYSVCSLLGNALFVLASPTHTSRAAELPHQLGY